GYKTGGREKGTQNKFSKRIRDALIPVLEGEILYLSQTITDFSDSERVSILFKILDFTISKPKPRYFDFDVEESKNPELSILSEDELRTMARIQEIVNIYNDALEQKEAGEDWRSFVAESNSYGLRDGDKARIQKYLAKGIPKK
ncbi:MAG: hypothetical protein IH819_07205, partial [Bacteroidetes bacterium]|nr:hypothetical protein [Bacteroidota bacterium]